MEAKKLEFETCKTEYKNNYCGTEMEAPILRDQCLELDVCRKKDADKAISSYNVLISIATEMANDMTEGLTPLSIGVFSGLIICAMCACGRCSARKNSETGKMEIKMGDPNAWKEKDKPEKDDIENP